MKIDWDKTDASVDANGRVRWARGLHLDPTHRDLVLNDFDLWYVWCGRGWISTPSGTVELKSGTCLWLRPGWDYAATQDPNDPVGHDFIHFSLLDTDTGQIRPFTDPLPPDVLVPFNSQFIGAAIGRIVEVTRGLGLESLDTYPAASGTANQILKGVLMDLDAASDCPPRPTAPGTELYHRQMMQAAAARITMDPADLPPVAELASEAGYSLDHFIRVFRDIYGKTPQQFAIDARIERAKQLLSNCSLHEGQHVRTVDSFSPSLAALILMIMSLRPASVILKRPPPPQQLGSISR